MTAKIRPLWPYTQGLDQHDSQGHPRPLPLPLAEKGLRAAARAGYADGERYGYVSGWRYGLLCGLVAGMPIGMASIWAAIELGLLIGV